MKRIINIILTFIAIFLAGTYVISQKENGIGATLPVAGQTYYLAGSGVSSSATSFTLTSFTIPQSGAKITDALISDTFYLTIEPGNRARQEIVGCTTVTQNGDGTATISGCTRGLSPVSPYTASTSLQFAHTGGSPVVISNPPQLYEQVGFLDNDETISGAWTTSVTPTSASGLATKGYVDGIVAGGSVTLDGIAIGATAGDTFATGTIVYFDAGGSNRWEKADADDSTTFDDVLLGVAQGAGTDGSTISGGVLTRGYDETNTGGTAGQTIYLSNTAGATSTSAGTNSVILGVMRSNTAFYFDPITAQYANLAGINVFTGTTTFTGETLEVGIIKMKAGATINGATLPVPVYASTTDNEVYAMDANLATTTSQKFIGFAVTNGTDGNDITVQTEGIVDGFTGLTENAIYYVQDTAGTIGVATGTYAIPVGIAVSETELLIKTSRRFDSGTYTVGTTVSNQTISLGFRPQKIRITGVWNDANGTAGNYSHLEYSWDEDNVNAISMYEDVGTSAGVSTAARLTQSTSNYVTVGVNGVNDTGFTMTVVETGTFPGGGILLWEAEGNY